MFLQTIKFSTLAVLAILATGCNSKQELKPVEQPQTPTASQVKNKLDGAPKWAIDHTNQDLLMASGSAAPTKAGYQFQLNEAKAQARNELARQISVKVNDMTKNFLQVTGIAKGETVDRVSSQVSKQVASETIAGSRQKDIWVANDGELFVLMVIDASELSKSIKNSLNSSFKNDSAAYQQLQAQKAQDELAKEIKAIELKN